MKTNEENVKHQKSGDQQSDTTSWNRRGFLKTGAALWAGSAFGNSGAGQTFPPSRNGSTSLLISSRRTLGSGKSGMEVSALGFGCMGLNYHRGVHPDTKAMVKLVHQVLERGVTPFDTAETYGPFVNEELTGEALAPFRKEVLITTKFGFKHEGNKSVGPDNRPQSIRQAAENSLKRLRIETIDLFYQHRLDPNVPIEESPARLKTSSRKAK